MMYKAIVTDRYPRNGRRSPEFITGEYPSKASFARNIRGNGYSVSNSNIKPEIVYDYILAHFNGNELVCRYMTVDNVKDLEAGRVTIEQLEDAAVRRYDKVLDRRADRLKKGLEKTDAFLEQCRSEFADLDRRDALEQLETSGTITSAEQAELSGLRIKIEEMYKNL